jgi:hypothetical protein
VLSHGFPSTASGDVCNGFSEPIRALKDSLLVVRPPLVETEHVVIWPSVDEGDIKLGRDLERLCVLALASLELFRCFSGTLDGLGLAATPALKEFTLRVGLIVLRVAEPASGDDGKPWFSSSIDPGSSTGRVGDDGKDRERGRLGSGLCISGADLGHMDAGERIMSFMTASKLEAELDKAEY